MKKTILYFLLLFSILACKDLDRAPKSTDVPITILPDSIENLWISEGNKEADTVLIILQGGPRNELYFEQDNRSTWRYLPAYENYLKAHLHQTNTLNPDLYFSEGGFTYEQAQTEVATTVEILNLAINYFKNEQKKVIVLGHSYGAFVILKHLAEDKFKADQYGIVSFRINPSTSAKESFKEGYNGIFEDGLTFKSQKGRDFSEFPKSDLTYYQARQFLKAAISEPSFSQSLKDVDLSNMIFIYSSLDQQVGNLTEDELEFLMNKNVQLYETKHPHSKGIYGFVDAIHEKKVSL